MTGLPERQQRVLALLGWLGSDGRRPGMLGRATGLSRRRAGRPDLIRDGRRWRPPESGDSLEAMDVVREVARGSLTLNFVHVEPDLAGELLPEAIRRAEESVLKLAAAQKHVDELMETEDDPRMPWVMATSALDRVLTASVTAVILAVAAAEAQVNAWAEWSGGWDEDEDRLSVDLKCSALAARHGVTLPLGQGALQALGRTVDLRNQFVHSKPVPQPMPLGGKRRPVPGRSISEDARRACLSVRQALLETSRAIGAEPPTYLAYCPPVAPEDDGAWSTANILAGSRDDPDFPSATA